MIQLIVGTFLSLLIALVGIKRRIGFMYSFLLGLTLSPIISVCIVLSSPTLKSYKAYEDNSNKNKGIAMVFFILGGLFLLNAWYMYYKYADIPAEYYHPNILPTLIFGIGFIILGYYLTHLPKYKKPENFDVMKSNEINKRHFLRQEKIDNRLKVKGIIRSKFKINKRKFSIGVLSLMVVLAFTNPSQKDFRDYIGTEDYRGLRREQNWIIFSVYNYRGNDYFAIFMNFFKIN